MPIPFLHFEEPEQGLPRQPVPLRYAVLVFDIEPRVLLDIIVTPYQVDWADDYGTTVADYLDVYEYDGRGEPRAVRPKYYEGLLLKTTKTTAREDLLRQIPATHFVWSDLLCHVLLTLPERYARFPIPDWSYPNGCTWHPALCGLDNLIEECPDFSALLAKSESSTKTSRRELRKAQTEARNERLRECAARIREANPKLTNNALAEKIYRDKNQNEGLEKETIRGIISGKK
jgi:hypothetical protein